MEGATAERRRYLLEHLQEHAGGAEEERRALALPALASHCVPDGALSERFASFRRHALGHADR